MQQEVEQFNLAFIQCSLWAMHELLLLMAHSTQLITEWSSRTAFGLKVALAAMNANEFVVRQSWRNTLPFSEVHCKRELAAWMRIKRFDGQVKMLAMSQMSTKKCLQFFPISVVNRSVCLSVHCNRIEKKSAKKSKLIESVEQTCTTNVSWGCIWIIKRNRTKTCSSWGG